MAITVTPEITGQVASSTFTYCYLYEPLRVLIEESNLSGTKIYIDIELVDMANSANIIDTYPQYAEFDVNPGSPISVDLMRLAQQLDDSNAYKFGAKDDWGYGPTEPEEVFQAELFRYRLNFQIYSDVTASQTEVKKWPIRGGREYEVVYDNPAVDENSPLTEFDYYGILVYGLVNPPPADDSDQAVSRRWGNVFIPRVTLNPANQSDATPGRSISQSVANANYPEPCSGGFLVWKSRFGGWMMWGFDNQTRNYSRQYEGQIQTGLFEFVERNIGGGITNNPFVAPDYTKIRYSYTRTLKAYSLKQHELLALAGINQSPAVYYVEELGENTLGRVELMRVTSATLPLDTKTSGGDFTVSLKSISTQHQNTR